jgi:hypothetical protein
MSDRLQLIVRAYVNFAGKTSLDKDSYNAFVFTHPEVKAEISPAIMKKAVSAYGEAFRDDIDPKINTAELQPYLRPSNEAALFFNTLPNTRVSSVKEHFKNFPFKNAAVKKNIKVALLTVYGADNLSSMDELNKSLDQQTQDVTGPLPNEGPATNPMDIANETDSTLPTPAIPETAIPDAPAGIDSMPQQEVEVPDESLPADIEEQAQTTLENYLIRDVFNSKLIPKVSITEAWKLQNGYVIKAEFASLDGSTKVYTTAVIHNNKIVLPAELEDAEGNKIDEFNKDAILKVFAVEGQQIPRASQSPDNLLSQMATPGANKAASATGIVKKASVIDFDAKDPMLEAIKKRLNLGNDKDGE